MSSAIQAVALTPSALTKPLELLAGQRVLVTGALGSLGIHTLDVLAKPIDTLGTDIGTMDVTDESVVSLVMRAFSPTVVFHLAGAKHALAGEEDPWAAAETNILGTRNVLLAAAALGARVITASTCKACNPETAYGATRLIAERMTLNAGGSVARFYNVMETSGNVFELWRSLPKDDPLPVNDCKRYIIDADEAVRLLLYTAVLPAGRYVPFEPTQWKMSELAASLYPGRPQINIGPRRGDRLEEPLLATGEKALKTGVEGIVRIFNPHDS